MSASSDTPETAGGGLPPGASAPPGAAGAGPMAERTLPVTGTVWRDVYEIGPVVGDAAAPRAWRAHRRDTGDEVLLRAVSVRPGDPRSGLWRLLESLSSPHLVRALPAVELGAQRIEVQSVPPGRPVRDWAAGRTVDAALLADLVRPLAAALDALHARGLGHFAVRPEHVFVADADGAPQVTLAGLEQAALCTGTELVPIPVDPFYAPPEAGGLYQHSPGAGLQAWDWWSLGRVLQGLILGRHVLGVVLQRDVSRITPELTARAEAFLLERETATGRAGGVEAMPGLEPRAERLLRGLLTGARDARWGRPQVEAWLRGEDVKEYYRLPRHERLFRWRDGAYPVAEVAVELRTAEHWPEAAAQLWEPNRPDSLAHFLGDSPAHRPLRDRIDEIGRLGETGALKGVPPAIVRDVVTAVALLELAGTELTWRGCRLDAEGLRTGFGAETADGADRLAVLQALATRPVVLAIERRDPDAARALTEFAETAAAAETLLRPPRWLRERDAAGLARLLRLALRPLGELQREAKALHERFACSTDPAVNKFFERPHPGRPELVALAWLGAAPGAFGFLTHAQWSERELARLRADGTGMVAGLFWMRVHRALAAGVWTFGSLWWVTSAWLLLAAAVALVWPGPRWMAVALAPLAVALLARAAGVLVVRRHLARTLPSAPGWRWIDGTVRSRREALAAAAGRRPAALAEALRDINVRIGALPALPTPAAPLTVRAGARTLWAVSLGSGLLFAAIVGLTAWRAQSHRPTWSGFVAAWRPPPEERAAAQALRRAASAQEPKGPVKVSWPYKRGDAADVLRVRASVEPTAEQARFAAERVRTLAERYKPETIMTDVVFRVPGEDGIALMIYDLRRRQPVVARVYLLDYAPMPRSWVELDRHAGIYLPD